MNYSDWTKKDYKVSLKKFWKWLKGKDNYPKEVAWIKTGMKNGNTKLPEELLTRDDIEKLINSTSQAMKEFILKIIQPRSFDFCVKEKKQYTFYKITTLIPLRYKPRRII